MRLFGITAMVVAILGTSILAPTSARAVEKQPHSIAIVDVAYIFKEHPAIKAQVEKVEKDLQNYDQELNSKREELKTAAEQLKAFKAGTPEYTRQEELVASLESKLRLDMARKRKELADAEARIYYDNYQRIAATVKLLAEYNQIDIVLRYNSEEMDLEKGDTVIRGVMKSIVFHNPKIDMTNAVMQYLDKAQVAAAPAAGAPR